ncbi:hypothetical protein [Aureispira sp. CCB-QB1]|nr:hypothetical protein [Aureispira sp. CCB-QB1]
MLIPDKSEHDLRTTFFIDPASLVMLGVLILMLMVADKTLSKLILKR